MEWQNRMDQGINSAKKVNLSFWVVKPPSKGNSDGDANCRNNLLNFFDDQLIREKVKGHPSRWDAKHYSRFTIALLFHHYNILATSYSMDFFLVGRPKNCSIPFSIDSMLQNRIVWLRSLCNSDNMWYWLIILLHGLYKETSGYAFDDEKFFSSTYTRRQRLV